MRKIISKKYSLFLLCSVVLVAVIAYAGGTTYGRYVHQESSSGVVVAKEFYFTSDYLKPEGANYTLNPGTEKITFQLRNYADDLRWADDTIEYKVYVNKDVINDETVADYEGTIGENPNAKLSKSITLDVCAGETYNVVAIGTAGYQETLSATFTVAPAEAKAYKYLEQTNEYVLLTVWTENINGAVTLSAPAGLIPDATDDTLSGINNYTASGYTAISEKTVGSLDKYSSHTYRFFKETLGNTYTVNDFTVTVKVDDVTFTVANPGTP